MTGLHGILLIATGVFHIIFALLPILYLKEWTAFFTNKFWNQITGSNDRKMAAFWFLIAGPLMVLMGMAIYEIELRLIPLPLPLGWGMFAFASFGTIMSPKSGFTFLLLPQSIFYLFSAYPQK